MFLLKLFLEMLQGGVRFNLQTRYDLAFVFHYAPVLCYEHFDC